MEKKNNKYLNKKQNKAQRNRRHAANITCEFIFLFFANVIIADCRQNKNN